jgi:hypothetical protein
MGTAQPAGGMTTRILAAAFGAIVAMAVAGCQLSDDDSDPVDETGSTSFYDSGSITTTDDAEIIYSDDSGNSLSTDF